MTNNLLFLKNLNKGTKGTDAIRDQARLWDIYAKISPIIFIVVAGVMWLLNIVQHDQILWAGAIIFAVTAVTWWFWTVHTIGKIAQLLRSADDGVRETLHDLRDIKDLVKQLDY